MRLDEDDVCRMNKVLRHRLRNFASGIKNAMALLEGELKEHLPPESQEYFPLIQAECDQLNVLTERLSMVFDPQYPVRVTARHDDRLQPISAILQKTLEETRRAYPAAEIVVTLEDTLQDEQLRGGTALTLALLELIRNAIEAARHSRITLQCEQQDEQLLFKVIDQGPGVGKGDPAQIFLPFHTTRGKHTGIGLAIAAAVLAEHNGRLSAETNATGGLTVTAHLPALKRETP
jgi:signal transduction histidine kinase